jgi:hypothetical protein
MRRRFVHWRKRGIVCGIGFRDAHVWSSDKRLVSCPVCLEKGGKL